MNNDTLLPKHGYLAFDALSMKAFLKQRLIDNGVFTDQIYEGSNLAQIIDVFALTFQNLIFYMNKTGAEGLFTDAQIYENLNRITKALGYNPIGHQSALLPYKLFATDLLGDKTYFVPRYSYISVNGFNFSTAEDIVFSPSIVDENGFIDGISNVKVLYQGTFQEYKLYEAVGDDYELMELNPGQLQIIDHFNIHVYIYDSEKRKWVVGDKTQSLYLNNANDYAYECRLNENGYYEIKFGNDICGRKLKKGDLVQIYYLRSDGSEASVGSHEADGTSFVPFQLEQYNRIMADVRENDGKEEITNANTGFLSVYNDTASTYYTEDEDVESMRTNAPSNFRAQYRLVTAGDFKSFISTNFSNVVHSTYIMNNWEYLRSYMKYLYTLGLSKPSSDTRMALNQFNFADACNFNNVYIFAVPKIIPENKGFEYIPGELKSMMLQEMNNFKVLTCEPVIIDPIYLGFKIGIPENGKQPAKEDGDVTQLVITKAPNTHKSGASIKSEVVAEIERFFKPENNQLGKTVEISTLMQNILSIPGVSEVNTIRTSKDGKQTKVSGISFVVFNEAYPEICDTVSSNKPMEGFQFPYYHEVADLKNHVAVDGDDNAYNTIEY